LLITDDRPRGGSLTTDLYIHTLDCCFRVRGR